MMACSYLSAGTKIESTGATCWSPPGVAGLTNAPLPTSSVTLRTGPTGLPNGPAGLPSGSIGLPSTSVELTNGLIGLPGPPMRLSSGPLTNETMGIPSGLIGLSSGPMGLPSEPVGLLNRSMGLSTGVSGSLGTNAPMRLPSGQSRLELPNGTVGPLAETGLPPPCKRSRPLELLSPLSRAITSASEPALDLSTSAASITSSLKSRLPSPAGDT